MIMDNAQDRALLHLGQALRDRGYHFITPTPLTHERVNQRPENALADDLPGVFGWSRPFQRSEEHTSELQSLMRRSYAVFCLKQKQKKRTKSQTSTYHITTHYWKQIIK